jgi:uncharacterized protein YkwD
MNKLQTLLATVLLSATCSCFAAGTATADSGHPLTPTASPLARIARTSTQPHHAHTTCKVTAKRHRKHARRCVKTLRARTHSDAGAPSRSGKSSALTSSPTRLHATHNAKPAAVVRVSVPNLAATIASVLATPCTGTELTPEPANLAQVEAATLCLVNQERARNNELPLKPNAQLAQSSQMHSEKMVSEDYFSHVAPNGETPLQRIQATGYIPNAQVGYTIGENIAWGTLYLATPSAIVAAWIASPEHLANILKSEYRDTAVGVDPAAPASFAEGQPGAVYTQEFGVISDS